MKKCPFCAEEIQDLAVRCRYCHSDLPAAEPRPQPRRISLAQGVLIACATLATCYIVLRLVYVSERRSLQASDVRADFAMPAQQRDDKTALPPLTTVSEQAESGQRLSGKFYLTGLIYFQAANYKKAREAWEAAVAADPGNEAARVGLERLRKLEAPQP